MRGFGELSEGKEWLMDLLKSKGFYDILDTDTISPYYHWDIEATSPKGERYVFELKNRTFSSDTFGDASLSKEKYERLKECPYKAVYVCFWTDFWCMIDIKSHPPEGFIERTSSRTTRFEDRSTWRHPLATWDIQKIHILDYDEI